MTQTLSRIQKWCSSNAFPLQFPPSLRFSRIKYGKYLDISKEMYQFWILFSVSFTYMGRFPNDTSVDCLVSLLKNTGLLWPNLICYATFLLFCGDHDFLSTLPQPQPQSIHYNALQCIMHSRSLKLNLGNDCRLWDWCQWLLDTDGRHGLWLAGMRENILLSV